MHERKPPVIRPCREDDMDAMLAVINAAAQAQRRADDGEHATAAEDCFRGLRPRWCDCGGRHGTTRSDMGGWARAYGAVRSVAHPWAGTSNWNNPPLTATFKVSGEAVLL